MRLKYLIPIMVLILLVIYTGTKLLVKVNKADLPIVSMSTPTPEAVPTLEATPTLAVASATPLEPTTAPTPQVMPTLEATATPVLAISPTPVSTPIPATITPKEANPKASSTIKPDQMIVYKPDNKGLEVYSLLPTSEILITKFYKTSWGTWNIHGWFISEDGIIPSKSSYALTTGGTDWEYVFRVKGSLDANYLFSGGNHGNEKLKDFILINEDSKSQLTLNEGDKLKLKRLKIIENTRLTLGDGSEKEYADVKRTYAVTPSQINLTTDFKFISDVYIGTSYVCMFPIKKEYGSYIKFVDTDKIYETPRAGTTLTSKGNENYIGNEETLSAEIWGYINPSHKFKVSIANKEMVDGFKNNLKVFYWDLNSLTNKLYFSKYNNSDLKKITTGTVWRNSQSWKFIAGQ